MKFGIRDGMLRVPFEERFQKAGELGFDGVELCLGGDYRQHPLFSDEGVETLLKLSEEAGVAVSSFSPGAFTGVSYLNPDDEKRREGIEKLNHLSSVAPQFGVEVILVPFFGGGAIPADRVTDQRLIDGVRETAETAAENGVALALETTLNAEQHIALIDAANCGSVGVYYDMGNATNAGYDSPSEIRRLGSKYIGQIHMKDTGGNHLGEGGVDFDAVGQAIKAIGYDSWLVLETPVREDADESNRKNLTFTRNLAA